MLDLPRGRVNVGWPGAQGVRIAIEGRLLDGAGAPIADALIEVWQADAEGRYHHECDPRSGDADPEFWGYARVATEDDGRFQFDTIKPGVVTGPNGAAQAPHILLSVCGTGILTRYMTRIYFDDEPATASDPVLAAVPAARRATLIARSTGAGRYRFDVVLQGENETVFFDL
jgi:protocatechuate 3,4-dioxygenase alpha subunit